MRKRDLLRRCLKAAHRFQLAALAKGVATDVQIGPERGFVTVIIYQGAEVLGSLRWIWKDTEDYQENALRFRRSMVALERRLEQINQSTNNQETQEDKL